jgi:hypothetical protein
MSAEYEEVVDADEVCASCGKAEVDDVKLKICACKLVKYCTIGYQKNHRPQHEEECKKRKTELRDKDLFTQPDDSHLGECPICCLPQSIDTSKSTVMPCCSKLLICKGCSYANQMREFEAGLEQRCAFCREPLPKSQEEKDKYVMNRVKKNCPVAMQQTGARRYRGEGDYGSALEYFTKSAELDDADAHHALSLMYVDGHGVEKDMEKVVYHMEEAAIAGHPDARYNLGVVEKKSGRFERARKHFIIAANLGFLNQLRILYADGNASKEEYFDALRAYQAAVDATKSVEREEAEAVQELRRRGLL